MKTDRLPTGFILIIAAVVIFLLSSESFGGVTQSNDQNINTSGDVSVGGDAFGVAHSLGDVDINQCLASTQWGSILVSKQKLVLNKWCAAESYDAKGLHQMAAMLRCDIPEVSKHFDSNTSCRAANTVSEPVSVPSTDVIDDDEEYHEEQRMEQMMLYEDLQAKIRNLEKKPKVTKQIIQQPYLTDEQKAALRELK